MFIYRRRRRADEKSPGNSNNRFVSVKCEQLDGRRVTWLQSIAEFTEDTRAYCDIPGDISVGIRKEEGPVVLCEKDRTPGVYPQQGFPRFN